MTNDPHGAGRVLQAGAPLNQARLGVVLLHGRGGSAQDVLGLASAFELNDVAYVAPEAAGHSWYPLSFLAERERNEPYLSSALRKVAGVVESIEEGGVPRGRIVIAGFSQGACLSTEFIATNPGAYGGLIAFTGGLIGPPGSTLHNPGGYSGDELAGVPALLMSGDPDPHVPWKRVEESAVVLSAMGARVETRRYPGRPHTVSAEEIALARALLESIAG